MIFITSKLSAQDCFVFPQGIDPISCEGDAVMNVFVHLDYEGTSDSFDVESEYFELGRFAYGDLPIMVAIPLSGDRYENLYYYDSKDTNCYSVMEIMPTCEGAPCGLTPIEVSNIQCTSDTSYTFTLDFGFHPDQDSFILDGLNQNFGIYQYAELPITVEAPLSGEGFEYYRVGDFGDLYNCARATQFEVSCIDTTCMLGEIELHNIECSSDSTYIVTVDLDFENTSDSFDLSSRNILLGRFSYSDLPIRLEVDLSGLPDELLRATDLKDSDCQSAIEFEVDCEVESCEIEDLEINNIECINENEYYVTLNFSYFNVNQSHFDVFNRDSLLGFYAFEDLPIRLRVPVSGQEYEFLKVSENDNTDCYAAIEFMVDCETSAVQSDGMRDVFVYPNPAKNELFISNTEGWTGKFLLQNPSGVKMKLRVNVANGRIDLKNVPKGIYFLRLEMKDGSWNTHKIIIQTKY